MNHAIREPIYMPIWHLDIAFLLFVQEIYIFFEYHNNLKEREKTVFDGANSTLGYSEQYWNYKLYSKQSPVGLAPI